MSVIGSLEFILGLIAGAGLTATCWHVNKFYSWLKKFEKPKPVPNPNELTITLDRMTARKAKDLLAKTVPLPLSPTQSHVTGLVFQMAGASSGERVVLENGAVRWLDSSEFWELMHPTPPHLKEYDAVAVSAEQLSNDSDREDPTEGWHQEKFDFTKIRSVKDTIADLQELVDLTVWQQDTVSRAAVWLSGLAEVNDAWWTEFIRLVDLLTEKPDDDHTRESLIELVSRVVATPVDAH